MASIFISYRREDSAGYSGRLHDRLSARFGAQEIFRDIDAIGYGEDYVKTIDEAVGSCAALIAVIGNRWLSAMDNQGVRRLTCPKDFVRLEIGAALSRNIKVIPVLVQGAKMPSEEELPQELIALAKRNALELSDARWDYDCSRLNETLSGVLGAANQKGQRAPALSVGSTPLSWARIPRFQPKQVLFALTGLVLVIAVPLFLSYGWKVPLSGSIRALSVLTSHTKSVPLISSDVQKVEESIHRIEASLVPDLSNRGKDGYESWATAQTTVALSDRIETNAELKSAVIDYFQQQMDKQCNCWREIPKIVSARHIPNSAWVMYAMARLHKSASDGQINFLLQTQQPGGWWAVFPTEDLQENASTYATGWAMLALTEQAAQGLVKGSTLAKVKESLARGEGWLLSIRTPHKTRWKDYPLSVGSTFTPPGKESLGISGLLLHVLHRLSEINNDTNLIKDLDQAWLENLPSVIPGSTDADQASRHINSIDGRVQENIHYLKLPWAIIATADAYQNGLFRQKLFGTLWIDRVIRESDMLSGELASNQNWARAEAVISLKHLVRASALESSPNHTF